MFKIIKKGSGNFWHNFNNGSKEVNLSDWEIVLDSVNQTVSLQMLNGANVPSNSVIISDVVVIDETDSSVEETFGSVEALRIRLVELNYTPYIVLNGFVPEAPIDGLTYGRKDAEWVEVSGGGSVGTLQQVTDNGNTTTNDITAGGFLSLGNANIPGINFNDAEDLDTSLGFLGADPSITTPRNWVLPDASGTIALISDIPPSITIDATPTDGSSNAVSSNGVFDALALKQNTLTETNFGSFINGLTAKNTLVDADEVVSDDSADSNKAKRTSWLNVWLNYLKPKADALYQAILTDVTFGTFSTALTPKTTPVDADTVNLSDSADSNKAKKTTWLNVWTNYLKVKADLLYQPIFSYVPIKSIIADYTTSSGVTGTTSETLISSYKINANTLSALDFMNMTLRLLKTGTTAGYLITIRIGTTSTFSTSLTQIAQYGWTLSTGFDLNFQRYFKIEGGSLKSSTFTYNILANQGVSVNSAESSTSFNVSVDNWIFISVKPQTNNADVITQSIFKITN